MKLSNECFSLQSASFWGLSLKVILTTPELYQKILRSLTDENHKYLVALIKFGTNFQSYNLKNGALTKRIYTFTMCLHLYYVSSVLCVLPNLKKGALTKRIYTFTMCLHLLLCVIFTMCFTQPKKGSSNQRNLHLYYVFDIHKWCSDKFHDRGSNKNFKFSCWKGIVVANLIYHN